MTKAVTSRILVLRWLAVFLAASLIPCRVASALIDYQRVLSLPPPPAFSDGAGLMQGRDGRLYGTLHSRANYGGALFRVATDGSGYTLIFSSATNRLNGLIEGHDGSLYGTIAGHPATNLTGIFRMDRDGGNFTILKTLSADRPQFNMVQHDAGWLYGTTVGDGGLNHGSIFKLATNGAAF
jgi:uncharacterized repeat protein (TIGR03803 family)